MITNQLPGKFLLKIEAESLSLNKIRYYEFEFLDKNYIRRVALNRHNFTLPTFDGLDMRILTRTSKGTFFVELMNPLNG